VRYPIPTADGATIDTDQQVILVRFKGVVYAFALSCPHQNTALKWLAEEGRFQCPKHKSKYQPDGTFISGRATRNMDRLPLRRDGASVVVDVDHVFESDKDPKEWAGALVRL
jgi:Rieske Fe-S protein